MPQHRTGTQAAWPLAQRGVLWGVGGHLWALVFRSPHPGPTVPTKPAVSLALPHELLFSCCFPDFPFVTASSIFARCVSAQLDCMCAERPEQQGSGADKETPASDHQLPHGTADAHGCVPLACWGAGLLTHWGGCSQDQGSMWASTSQRTARGSVRGGQGGQGGATAKGCLSEWDWNRGRALSRC